MGEFGQALGGQHDGAGRDDVRKCQYARAGRHGGVEQFNQLIGIVRRDWNRNLLHHDAVTFRPFLPTRDSAGMLTIREDDLVAPLEIKSVCDKVHAHRRILDHRQIPALGIHQPPELLAQRQFR